MAPIKIKARGRSAAKSTDEAPKPTRRSSTRKSTSKAPAKRQSAKRDSTTAKAAASKRSPGRPRKNTSATATATAPQRRNSTGVDPKVEAKLQKLVEKMGDRRAKAEAEHKEAINALHEAATEALDAGVSMAKVSDWSGISRQWLYKMGDFRGRGNGNGNGSNKPAPKPAATRKSAAPQRQSARKGTSARKSATKTQGGSRRRVAIRSAG